MKIEEWNGHEIRFVWHDGEWWAVAKDVAKALGYKHTPHMVRMMRDDQKADVHLTDTSSNGATQIRIGCVWEKKQTEYCSDRKKGVHIAHALIAQSPPPRYP